MERLNFFTSNQDQKKCPNLLARIEQQQLTKVTLFFVSFP